MSDQKEFPSDKADKFVVRFPDGMRDRIAEAAKANGRSMNAEIISRLEGSIDDSGKGEQAMEMLSRLIDSHDRLARAVAGKDEAIAALGNALSMAASMVAETGDAKTDGISRALQQFGEHIAAGRTDQALMAADELERLRDETDAPGKISWSIGDAEKPAPAKRAPRRTRSHDPKK